MVAIRITGDRRSSAGAEDAIHTGDRGGPRAGGWIRPDIDGGGSNVCRALKSRPSSKRTDVGSTMWHQLHRPAQQAFWWSMPSSPGRSSACEAVRSISPAWVSHLALPASAIGTERNIIATKTASNPVAHLRTVCFAAIMCSNLHPVFKHTVIPLQELR